MTEHLSECFASLCECDDTHFKSIDCDFSCICPSLRACEQRVLSLNPVGLGVLIAQRARERALDAAREAVETLPLIVRFVKANKTKLIDQLIDRDEALAAIDALGKK